MTSRCYDSIRWISFMLKYEVIFIWVTTYMCSRSVADHLWDFKEWWVSSKLCKLQYFDTYSSFKVATLQFILESDSLRMAWYMVFLMDTVVICQNRYFFRSNGSQCCFELWDSPPNIIWYIFQKKYHHLQHIAVNCYTCQIYQIVFDLWKMNVPWNWIFERNNW